MEDYKKRCEQLEKIIALMPGNVYWKDKEHRFLGCNNNVARILGLNSCKDIIGKRNHDLFDPHLAKLAEDADAEIISTNTETTFEEIGLNAAGEETIYLTKKTPLHDTSGGAAGILGVSLDISDRKKAEQDLIKAKEASAAEKMKAQMEQELRQAVMVLSGSIAHDLRTPISTLNISHRILSESLAPLLEAYRQTPADKLNEPLLDAEDLLMLEEICEKLPQITRRMNDDISTTLKTLSKALLGELQTNDLLPCSMNYCLNNILSHYPYQEAERQLVQREGDEFTFMGNFVLFTRVMNNLIKNALEQIQKNQRGEIFITSEALADKNILRVKDTAGGAPPEIIERLFEGYQTTKEKGTGVGLAFCKLTLQSFNGDIECYSEYGSHIEFVLSFPKVAENADLTGRSL